MGENSKIKDLTPGFAIEGQENRPDPESSDTINSFEYQFDISPLIQMSQKILDEIGG